MKIHISFAQILEEHMKGDLLNRNQLCGDGTKPKQVAFLLQQENDIEEQTLVKNLIDLIKKNPNGRCEGTFPRKYSKAKDVFNKKAELIIQRLTQEKEDLNKFGTVTHLKDLLGDYGHELTIVDELSTPREKAHAVLRQVYEGSALDNQPWYEEGELAKTVNHIISKFTTGQIKQLLENRAALKNHWLRELKFLRKQWEEQTNEDRDIERAVASFSSEEWLSSHLLPPYPEILSLAVQRQFLGTTQDLRQQVINIFRVNQQTVTGSVALKMGGDSEDVRITWFLLNHMKLSAAVQYQGHSIEGVSSVKLVYAALMEEYSIFKHFLVDYNAKQLYKTCSVCGFAAPSSGHVRRHRRRAHANTRQIPEDDINNNSPGDSNNNLVGRGM